MINDYISWAESSFNKRIHSMLQDQEHIIEKILLKIQDWQDNNLPIFLDCIGQPVQNHDTVLLTNYDPPVLAEITFDCSEFLKKLALKLDYIKRDRNQSNLCTIDLSIDVKYKVFETHNPDSCYRDYDYDDCIFLDTFIQAYDCYKNQQLQDMEDRLHFFRVPKTTEQYESIIEKIMIEKLSKSTDEN